MGTSEDAKAVSEALLEATWQTFRTKDFLRYKTLFLLPQEVETFEGRNWILDETELRAVFDRLQRLFEGAGVTEMVRRCLEAEFTSPDTIEATHETRLLSGNQIVSGPYPCFSILQRINGNWQVAFTQNAVTDNSHCRALVGDKRALPEDVKQAE